MNHIHVLGKHRAELYEVKPARLLMKDHLLTCIERGIHFARAICVSDSNYWQVEKQLNNCLPDPRCFPLDTQSKRS